MVFTLVGSRLGVLWAFCLHVRFVAALYYGSDVVLKNDFTYPFNDIYITGGS